MCKGPATYDKLLVFMQYIRAENPSTAPSLNVA